MRSGVRAPGPAVRRGARFLLAVAIAGQLCAATVAERVQRLLASSPAARTAFWGIQAVDLGTGRTLYAMNSDRFFVPASNTKLFTAALALARLGPDYTFQTRVLAQSPPDEAGVIRGALRLTGGGDPNLSARAIPYRMGPLTGNPLAAIEDLADQVAARGVRRIDGDIIGDDTWYVWEPYAEGWGIDDPQFEYGAPVSALTVNDNALTLRVRPGARENDLAAISLNPPLPYYGIDNRIRTGGGERKIRFQRDLGAFELRLWGSIPARDSGEDLLLGIEDPARYAASALRQALEDRGIAVAGGAVAEHLFPNQVADLTGAPAAMGQEGSPPGTEMARRNSAPLIEDLRVTAKVSQNLHAELALRAVGRARRNVGSREAGLEELKAFLAEAGVDAELYSINDGSGLSRLNLVTPAAVVRLLRFMYGSPARESWISLLPVGGLDGTLSSRFSEAAAAGRIHAKTGTLSHVSALSGYIQKPNGDWIAFSILVNNFNGHPVEVRGVMDRICTLIEE